MMESSKKLTGQHGVTALVLSESKRNWPVNELLRSRD